MRAPLALLLVALVAAGCTGRAPTPARDALPGAPQAPARVALAAPEAVEHRALNVTLDVQDRWIRPGETVVATAHAPASARVAWFLATRNPVLSPTWPHKRADATMVPSGAERAATALPDPGRYVFGLGAGPLLNVTVDPRLPPAASATVDALDTPQGVRFAPDEATAGQGGVLVVRNHATSDLVLVERDWLGLLPVEGAAARFPMPATIDLGDYDLRAVATDASGAVGEATARLLYDSRKPDENATLGPFNGTLRAGAPPPVGDAPVDSDFSARFAMRELDVVFRAASDLPGPVAITVQVVGPTGAVLDTSDPGPAGRMTLHDLPAGAYGLRVSASQGAMLRYTVEAQASLVLVPPGSFFGT